MSLMRSRKVSHPATTCLPSSGAMSWHKNFCVLRFAFSTRQLFWPTKKKPYLIMCLVHSERGIWGGAQQTLRCHCECEINSERLDKEPARRQTNWQANRTGSDSNPNSKSDSSSQTLYLQLRLAPCTSELQPAECSRRSTQTGAAKSKRRGSNNRTTTTTSTSTSPTTTAFNSN